MPKVYLGFIILVTIISYCIKKSPSQNEIQKKWAFVKSEKSGSISANAPHFDHQMTLQLYSGFIYTISLEAIFQTNSSSSTMTIMSSTHNESKGYDKIYHASIIDDQMVVEDTQNSGQKFYFRKL